MSRRRVAAGTGLSLGAALGMGATAQAADFTVTSTADNGGGAATTLREAILAADNGGGNDRILFQSGLTGTITLNGTQLPTIDEPLQIVGPGAEALIVSGADASRILSIDSAPGDDVTLSRLTLTRGDSSGAGAIYSRDADLTIRQATLTDNNANFAGVLYSIDGATTIEGSEISKNTADSSGEGAILSNGGGALTIRDSELTGNMANFAGAIYSIDEATTIERTTISGNKALSSGEGGILSNGGGPLVIRDSTVSGNTADFAGALYTIDEATTIERSTISNNKALSSGEGGILSNGGGPLTIRDSTVSGNTADFAGGIYSIDEATTIERSTVSGNKALSGTAGGILQNGLALVVESSTVSGNSSTSNGGGIYSSSSAPDPVLTNSVVANNSAPSSPDLQGGGGDQFNTSFSLIEESSGATVNNTVAGSNLIGMDPRLGPLANNGGPTLTHALLPGGPALDKGSAAASADQRGAPRPFNLPGVPSSTAAGADGADMGAYELVRCGRVLVNRVGTSGKDKLLGSAKRDGILGLGGRDVLRGLKKGDALCGGAGRDRLLGGKGNDLLLGQAGRDRLLGGPGRDRLKGGPGRDRQKQ